MREIINVSSDIPGPILAHLLPLGVILKTHKSEYVSTQTGKMSDFLTFFSYSCSSEIYFSSVYLGLNYFIIVGYTTLTLKVQERV